MAKHEIPDATLQSAAAGTALNVPASGANPLKTLDDWRGLFHQLVPVIVTALVAMHIATDNQVALWIPFVFAIADPLLSLGNTADKIRRVIYGLLAALQAGSAITAVIEVAANHASPVVAPVITAGGALISGVLGKFFTPNSNLLPDLNALTANLPNVDPQQIINGLMPKGVVR